MNRALSLAGTMAIGLWVVCSARSVPADTGDNPYLAIVERNVFGLKPLPKPEELAPAPPPAPPSKVTLQGIMVLGGKRQVLLKLTPPPTPGQQPKEQPLIMSEGERQGALEVVRIDPEAREVEFRDSGTPVTLKLVDFIAKNTGPVPAAPGAPGAPPGVRPGAIPAPTPAVPTLPGVRTLPTPTPTASTASPAVGSSGTAVSSLPNRLMRTMPSSPGSLMVGATPMPTPTPAIGNPGQPRTSPVPQLTPEEQMVLMEVERERTKAAVAAGQLPPLPPTPLTPPDSMPPMAPPALPPMPGK